MIGSAHSNGIAGFTHAVEDSLCPGWAAAVTSEAGSTVLIRIDPGSGRIDAAGDPKARRHAAAF
jgi:hypothetical protein